MANPPPPYANITGISRTVMKDNAQESIVNYDGNARPGEIVADLTQDPPTLYIGNNLGQLTAIASGGGGNTGNVTFSDQIVIGTGDPGGGSGLYLAPGPDSTGNLQYLRVRGGDYVTHIHLDTGNNAFFDQYFGDDNKYVKLEATGNIVVNSNDGTGNAAQWTFGTGGNLTTPQGMIVSGNVNFLGTDTALLNPADNTPLSLFTSGANSTVTSFWAEDVGNLMTSNIAGFYLPLQGTQTVRIVNGSNGGNIAIYDFTNTGTFTAQTVTTAPVALSTLTAEAGARAFVNNANLVAAGNFGANVSGGGSNTVPVWSDGTNWYIG